MKFIKCHWKKLIGVVAVIAVLVFAYWYGGAAPGSKGFRVNDNTQESEVSTDAALEEADKTVDTEASEQMAAEDTDGNGDTQQADTEDSQLNEDNTEVSDANANEVTDKEDAGDTAGTDNTVDEGSDGSGSAGNSTGNDGKGNSGSGAGDSNTGANTGSIENAGNSTGGSSGNSTGDSNAGSGSGGNGGTGTGDAGTDATTESSSPQCTISISCSTILNNMLMLDSTKTSIVPSDGWILKTITVDIEPGDTVYDILRRVTKEHGISLEYSYTAIYGSYYIEGIANLYEFDCGELSGWMYSVNGKFPNYGCSKYVVSDGDVIKWVYTCDLGADVGNPY